MLFFDQFGVEWVISPKQKYPMCSKQDHLSAVTSGASNHLAESTKRKKKKILERYASKSFAFIVHRLNLVGACLYFHFFKKKNWQFLQM